MFEAINEDEFKTKLEETLSQMHGFFDISGNFDETTNKNGSSENTENLPDAQKIHEHITGMLDGKLGQLACEIAEETAASLNMDLDNTSDMKDVFQQLVKNPTKLMDLVKTVGEKLDTKIKSGDIKESEFIAEAAEIMNKMKNMPGMDNIQTMLSKMGMGNLSGLGGKVDVGAMDTQLKQKLKMAKTKERILAKAEERKKRTKAEADQKIKLQQLYQQPTISEDEILKIFSSGEKIERTPRGSNNKKNKK
jgi:hypothetical protein